MARLQLWGIDPPDVPSFDWIVLTAILAGTTLAVLGTALPGV